MRPVLLCGLSLVATPARAADIPCSAVESGVIHIDGLLDDWSDVAGIDSGGHNRDLSFTVKCNYDESTLFLAIDVRDDYLVRLKAAKPGEDHVTIGFGDGDRVEKLLVWPADLQSNIPHKLQWGGRSKQALRGITASEARQPEGWSVELAMRRSSVPGWAPGAPLRLAVEVADSDSRAKPTTEATQSTAPMDRAKRLGASEFAEAKAAFDNFLRDRNLQPRDLLFDKVGRVLPRGSARVVVVGKTLAIVSDEYVYIDLPVRDRRDIKEVRLIDLAGDGRDAIVVRYSEHGGGGAREVLAAFRLVGAGLQRVFGCELAKSQGAQRLVSKVSFVKRGRGTEILVEPLPAVGWTEATYQESTAGDMVPILTPWAPTKRARFRFRGDNYFQVD